MRVVFSELKAVPWLCPLEAGTGAHLGLPFSTCVLFLDGLCAVVREQCLVLKSRAWPFGSCVSASPQVSRDSVEASAVFLQHWATAYGPPCVWPSGILW